MLLLLLACTRNVPNDKVQDSPSDPAHDTADTQPNDTGETGEVDWPVELHPLQNILHKKLP